MDDQVKVSVPAQAGFVTLLRSVVAGAAGHLGFGIDAIEDLRLAVGEACADLLELDRGSTTLGMHLVANDDGLDVVVWTDGQAPGWPRTDVEDRLAWLMLHALADEASMLRRPEGPAIRLVKRRTARGA
jgi:serine/threonine-protein kinase RsbW